MTRRAVRLAVLDAAMVAVVAWLITIGYPTTGWFAAFAWALILVGATAAVGFVIVLMSRRGGAR